MMATFFTADTHFGHDNIRKFCDRPFDSADEMDAALIENWNAAVGPKDDVYHLGDFAFRAAQRVPEYLQLLNGRIHLIIGNHDAPELRHKPGGFASVYDLRTIKLNGRKITLCHYAMRVWPASHRGTWHLYGHSHGNLPDDPKSRSFDIGVDCHDYRPLSFDEVEAIMDKKDWEPPFD